MLAPDQRTLLADLLAPPAPEFRLERALATTFTLDLTALLPVMLGFAGSDVDSSADPMSLIQAVRKYVDRFDVFCQAGSVKVPEKRNDLLEFLGPVVHQVKAPPGGLFHPKLWILRYSTEDCDQRYRLVCGSRNLTHDRSWDTVITLEGQPTKRNKKRNRPIADFLNSLADRLPNGLDNKRRQAITELAEGIRSVEWEPLADEFSQDDWLAFHFFGPTRTSEPNMSGRRRLIVSPFLNEEGIDSVWPQRSGDCTLISRSEELDLLDPEHRDELIATANVRNLNEEASLPDLESEDSGPRWSLSGLHSKLYVVERDHRAHVFVGSANATDAAWNRNDEVLVEFVGRARTYGVEAIVGEKSPLSEILVDYAPGEAVVDDPEDALLRKVESALRDLAGFAYAAHLTGNDEELLLSLSTDSAIRLPRTLAGNAELKIAPLTVRDPRRTIENGTAVSAKWALDQIEDVTPFFVLSLSAEHEGSKAAAQTVVLARLHGDHPERLDRLLARQFKSPSEFMRFVMLLLQFAGGNEIVISTDGFGAGAGDWSGGGSEGLLESILEALVQSPKAIDDIDRLAARLGSTDTGRELLPHGWDALWQNVMLARDQIDVI